MGYRYLTLAEAVRDWHVNGGGGEFVENIFSQLPGDADSVRFTVPVQSASDRATLSLVALDYFERAALVGALAFDPQVCGEDVDLAEQVPAGTTGEEGGLDDSAMVTVGFVLASGTQEAVERMGDAYGRAQEYITAAGRANLTDMLDEEEARREMWRGMIDSRLELTRILGGVPWELFEEPRDGEYEGVFDGLEEGARPNAGLDICGEVSTRPEDVRSRDLIQGLGIDFLSSGAASMAAQVRDAMLEEFPEVYQDLDTEVGGDPEAFVMNLGLAPAELERAGADLQRQVAVQGRVVVDDPERPGRIRGLDPGARPVEPAFLLANTLGRAHFDESASGYDEHAPTLRYAIRGTLTVEDYVAGTLQRALGSTLVSDPEARIILNALRQRIREDLPMRLNVCIGQPPEVGIPTDNPDEMMGGAQEVRIRLYGVREGLDSEALAERYELWVDDAGLECGRTGAIAGVPCDRDDWRLAAGPVLRTDGGSSGLGEELAEWLFDATAIPSGPVEAGTTTGRVYVTERLDDAGRRVIGSFTGEPGNDEGDWSRCITLPVGDRVLEDVREAVASAATTCNEPATLCGGLPFDLELPLEDELTEASTGRDDIESSFARFLDEARLAADEADMLAEELLRQGLDWDRRAERARDELEDICGGVINVGDLPAAPQSCTGSADCASGLECESGVCSGRLSDQLESLSETDRAALSRCLGETGTEAVSLGQAPLCFWRIRGGAPCTCDEDTCPPESAAQCPQPRDERSDTSCDELYSTLTGVPGLTVHETIPLKYVSPPSAGGSPPRCESLARLRHRAWEEGKSGG